MVKCEIHAYQTKDVSPTCDITQSPAPSKVENCWVQVGVAVGSGTWERVTENHVQVLVP